MTALWKNQDIGKMIIATLSVEMHSCLTCTEQILSWRNEKGFFCNSFAKHYDFWSYVEEALSL